jgi:hypothetical protein
VDEAQDRSTPHLGKKAANKRRRILSGLRA